jgi:hypothetical protein
VLRDRTSGGELGLPLDRINAVGRAAGCLDDSRWWSTPTAIQAAAWATVPGSGPQDVDPWQLLSDAADKGDASGVRVARALHVRMASNAGLSEMVAEGISAHAASLNTTKMDMEWALMDEYARLVTLHESDLLWTDAEGHRTPTLGELPTDEAEVSSTEDVFGDDPFGDDPFDEPSAPDSTDEASEDSE